MKKPIEKQKARTMNYFEDNPLEKEELKKNKKKGLKDQIKVVDDMKLAMKQRGKKEEVKEEVKIKKEKQPKEKESNGSVEEDEKNLKSRRVRKGTLVGLAVVLIVAFLVGGLFAFDFYETNLKKVSVEQVLDGNSNLVLLFNVNAEFDQYKLLDSHARKFPGYKFLQKELDDAGEGKEISVFLQDKLRENNLSFQEDISPALGDDLYFVIPSLEALEKNIQDRISHVQKNTKNLFAQKMQLHRENARMSESQIALSESENMVLGATSDYYTSSNWEMQEMQSIDFVVAAPVEDLKEAREVLAKIKMNKEDYEMQEKKHQGYLYYEVKRTQQMSSSQVFDVSTTYHALLGKNWIMSTDENYLKDMISQRKSSHLMTVLKGPFQEKVAKKTRLAENKNYAKVISEISSQAEKNIVRGYFSVNFEKFFSAGQSQHESINYFKYPKDFSGGFVFRAEENGVTFRSISNQVSLGNPQASSYKTGLVESIPSMLDNRFADVYFENENPKQLYYNFKQNNLTKDGLDMWNETRGSYKEIFGFDPETDIIDQLEGRVGFVLFAKRGLEPEEVFVAEIKDSEEVVKSANKVVEAIKNTYAGFLSMRTFMDIPHDQQGQLDMVWQGEDPEQVNELFASILGSKIIETETEFGKIYSYKLPGMDLVSFDFGFHENKLILGSHYAVVEGMMKEFKQGSSEKLANSEQYNLSTNYLFDQGHSKTYVNTFGLWNAASYYLENLFGVDSSSKEGSLFGIGALLRTINVAGSMDGVSADGKSSKSSIYLNIKELPAEEKGQAEAVIEKNF